jgi:hypothetical protein
MTAADAYQIATARYDSVCAAELAALRAAQDALSAAEAEFDAADPDDWDAYEAAHGAMKEAERLESSARTAYELAYLGARLPR